MKQFTSKELRNAWKAFYQERGHVDVGAVSLVSDGSTGVMFNVAGMQPLMPYLLGKKHPLGTRLCNVQGCVRTNDIDSVGDKSHVTFFEMMGSWSLGDYFKEERCKWSFELLTEVFGFDAEHLAATVFAGDDNAPRDEEGAKYRIASGFKPENIYYLPAEDNWWGLEFGPCGPDSEMFYVSDTPDCGPDCGPGCHCGKYTELGNDVFMQYEKHQDGRLTPLEKKNVDTGWGLERILAFLNGTRDVYQTDLFAEVIAFIEKESGCSYAADDEKSRSMRILADHLRTAVMLIGDEAKLLPSNGGAGYVLRRLIRRAVRHGRLLGLSEVQFLTIASMYIDLIYAESYPNLVKNRAFVLAELKNEIARFVSTIENGMKEFVKILEGVVARGENSFPGKEAFYLYDTFGFPLELTIEMAEEKGLHVDEDAFEKAMEAQKQKAREAANFGMKGTTDAEVYQALLPDVVSEFTGYDTIEDESEILAIVADDGITDLVPAGTEATVITARTPFYPTMGGQKGDFGTIENENGSFHVAETVKLPGGRIGHVGKVVSGEIVLGQTVSLNVDATNRASTCRNHSATHLLQKALQKVLSDDVKQQGSYQDGERTRFDFSYGQALGAEELAQVEELVNAQIAEDLSVETKVMRVEDAKRSGAMALFGEKYEDDVRVVSMGDFSKELCGGTHVSHTGEIRNFKILSESGIAAGVRRIEAITGNNVIRFYQEMEQNLKQAASAAKSTPEGLTERIVHLQAELKSLHAELESMKAKAAKEAVGDVLGKVKDVNGVKLLAIEVDSVDMNGLRDLGDELKEKIGDGVVVIASAQGNKVNLIAMATDAAMQRRAHAGNLIKGIAGLVGGGGGGRPNMAQAGGKNPAGIADCLKEAEKVLSLQVS